MNELSFDQMAAIEGGDCSSAAHATAAACIAGAFWPSAGTGICVGAIVAYAVTCG